MKRDRPEWVRLTLKALARGGQGLDGALRAARALSAGYLFRARIIEMLRALREWDRPRLDGMCPALSRELSEAKRSPEAAAIALGRYCALASLAEKWRLVAAESQAAARRDGVAAALQGAELAGAVSHNPLRATLLGVAAGGEAASHDFRAARTHCEEALGLYRQLAASGPDTYRPYVATTANNLGRLLSELHDFRAARTHFEEALALYRELAEGDSDAYRPCVAGAANNLGMLLADLGDFGAARQLYDEALRIQRELAQRTPRSIGQPWP